jgi:sterol desaturase/sphingolipid hydroxylase (fatty acid hydroxylase superfamily)
MTDFVLQLAWSVVWLVVFVAIFVPLERYFALHDSKIGRKQLGVDLAWYFINSIVPALLMALPLMALTLFLQKLNTLGFYAMVAAWPMWVKAIVAIVVNDIGSYWGHRASHSVPWLWRFHEIHHSAEHMDWLVSSRAHPLDMVVTRMAGLAPVYLLGLVQNNSAGEMNEWLTLGLLLISVFWGKLIHANLNFRWRPLEGLIATPFFHHWHHTKNEHYNKNFAAMFPWIDRLFGTIWLPKNWPKAYGITTPVAETLSGQLIDPLINPSKRRVKITSVVAKVPQNDSDA